MDPLVGGFRHVERVFWSGNPIFATNAKNSEFWYENDKYVYNNEELLDLEFPEADFCILEEIRCVSFQFQWVEELEFAEVLILQQIFQRVAV